MLRISSDDKDRLIDPLFRAGPRFRLVVALLIAVVAWGVAAFVRQTTYGLGETGMSRPTYWGMYIVNFIFLIGVSMAGTVITAVLYLIGASWRRPIVRIAEATTVFGLMIAGLQVIVDMGRPERMLSMFIYGRLQSPLLWDVASLSVYLLTSAFALYVSLLPDLGIVRDNLPDGAPGWRRLLYRYLALGWRGNREQWRRLERVSGITAVLVIPIGVSLHTVTSWILSTTLQPGWHSTILGPYFVVGAIFSGLALLLILLSLLREIGGIKFYIDERHYRNLGWLFITMTIVWFYFTYTEHLTLFAGQDEVEFPVLASKLWGPDAPAFWGMVVLMTLAACILILPLLLPRRWAQAPFFRPGVSLATAASSGLTLVAAGGLGSGALVSAGLPGVDLRAVLLWTGIGLGAAALFSALAWLRRHVVAAHLLASLAVVTGMWLERWNIIVPTMTHPRMIAWLSYVPTVTEWAITAASFAIFALLLLAFFKLFPAVSLWEVAQWCVEEAAKAGIQVPLPPSIHAPAGHDWRTPWRSL